MRTPAGCLVFTLFSASVLGQPVMTESVDFPPALPGPPIVHSGASCFWAASGSIAVGDVDWLQISLPFDSTRTVVDVDFAAGASRSLLLTSVPGGGTGFNMGDGNNAADNLCGLGSASSPAGNTLDNAVDLGATGANTIVNVGISGYPDFSFRGSHSQTFAYDVWVYAEADLLECTTDADCDDGVACTVDRCDPVAVACLHSPDDGLCDDGKFCTGVERCDQTGGCQVGTDPDCDDGVDCTEDECDDDGQACTHAADDEFCDNGVFCDGAETCDLAEGCVTGPVVDCDDAIDCTADACDNEAAACTHVADDSLCDNGLFCDGTEVCDLSEGCRAGESPCPPDQVCDEAGGCQKVERYFLDIRPERCPNRFNVRGRGRLRVALLGTASFDVNAVDTASLELVRADGLGGSASPLDGRHRHRIRVHDVGTPVDGDPCDCRDTGRDGVPDLVIKFFMADIATNLDLGNLPRRETVELTLHGRLLDGTPFSASDCITIVARGSTNCDP